MPDRTASPERSSAELIEGLNKLEIPDPDKVDILLVYLGEKPATHHRVMVAIREPGQAERTFDHAAFDAEVEWAKTAGLMYKLTSRTINPDAMWPGTEGEKLRASLEQSGRLAEQLAQEAVGRQRDELDLYVARDEVRLAQMEAAHLEGDSRLYGESVGFPATAVDAYMDDHIVSPDTVTSLPASARPFAYYGFSPEHADAEVATAVRWAEAVRRTDPVLYQRRLDSQSNG